MANHNPKPGPGRPKGSGNKTPILLRELESVVFELPKPERMKRLRDYRDFPSDSYKITDKDGKTHRIPVYKNFVSMHMTVAKKQEETGQTDLFDGSEEEKLIAEAEADAERRCS